MNFVDLLAYIIDFIAVIVLVIGLIMATVLAFRSVRDFEGSFLDKLSHPVLRIFRISLGRWTLAALGILIISDILHSTVHRDLEEMVYLGGIVAIRVTLAFFLDREIQRMEDDMRLIPKSSSTSTRAGTAT